MGQPSDDEVQPTSSLIASTNNERQTTKVKELITGLLDTTKGEVAASLKKLDMEVACRY